MKHVVITGANRGIGLDLAKHYASEGWAVIGVCRESSAELDRYAGTVISGIDVTNKECIRRVAAELKGKKVDLLINNAGVLNDDVLGSLDIDSLRVQMEVNAFAPLMLCEALMPSLAKGSKVAKSASQMGKSAVGATWPPSKNSKAFCRLSSASARVAQKARSANQ